MLFVRKLSELLTEPEFPELELSPELHAARNPVVDIKSAIATTKLLKNLFIFL